MEKKFQVVGGIFSHKANNTHPRNNDKQSASSEQANSDSNSVFGIHGDNFISNIQKTGEMATVKLGWIILNWVGFPIFIYTWINTIWTGDEFKQWVLFGFAVIFTGIKIWHSFERARTIRIENNERAYALKKKHDKDNLHRNIH